MEADFAVELGPDDETLEIPWSSESGPRYYDLKRHPELLLEVEEARLFPELGEFLSRINAGNLETAKCDAWTTSEMNVDDEIFGAVWKFGSYVDLLFSDTDARFSFPAHEHIVEQLTKLLKKVPEISCAAEFLVRRCYYHVESEVRDGFYITFYLFGYGDDEAQAQQRWGIGLKLVENAIRQVDATRDGAP
jgi:hypothetical protein